MKRNCRLGLRLFPPEDRKKLRGVQEKDLTLKTVVGDIVAPALYGTDRETGELVMPLRERLGLEKNQSMTPALQDRLSFLAISSKSFGRASEMAAKFGVKVDGSQIQRLAQHVGARAEAQEAERVSAVFDAKKNKEITPKTAHESKKEEPFVMVIMQDGLMLRNRGGDWGLKPESAVGERVVWHELKAGLVIRIPESSLTRDEDKGEGRKKRKRKRPTFEKYYVADAGGPEAIGKKLYAEAKRRGVDRARRVYVVSDGAAWIWNLAEEHFPGSGELLDFYHATEHLWALGRILWGADEEEKVKAWVTPLRSTLRYRGGVELLPFLEELLKTEEAKKPEMGAGRLKELNREVAYFRKHESRLDYPEAKRQGMPLGSGAMESACSQIQGRFKCTGQFWSPSGERHLLALELAWRNRDWNELWSSGAA